MLTLTTSGERVRSFTDVYQRYGDGLCPPSVFLFGELRSFVECPLCVPLQNGRGEPVVLVE